MRDMAINQQTIFYQNKIDIEATDKWGNPISGFGEIKQMKICVTGNAGEPTKNVFGNDLKYDRTMTTHDTNCTIDEFTRLWIDTDDTSKEPDYTVKAVSKTYSCIKYAIEKS